VAQHLASHARVRRITLLDDQASVAAGLALDLQQSGPIDGADVAVTGSGDLLAAAGAAVIVIADRLAGGDWQGEAGLAMVRQLTRTGTSAPLVFAGASQTWLMETVHAELHVPGHRLVGTAASGLVTAIRALAGAELGVGGVDLTIAGRPPAFVAGWSVATVGGILLTDRVPPHRLLSLSRSIPRLWPPGPRAIGAATAAVVEALAGGSRRLHAATTILDGELGVRGLAALMPLELGQGRVQRVAMPSFSPQERTDLMNSLSVRTARA
jgi:malate dehydrogenase